MAPPAWVVGTPSSVLDEHDPAEAAVTTLLGRASPTEGSASLQSSGAGVVDDV